ncbi:lamin tail domain-containing protein [Candidatus Uhrbacteria bacterium]|nr:lamin tail domain-containing protein [Candidatus Uhrbacteria bacterium]
MLIGGKTFSFGVLISSLLLPSFAHATPLPSVIISEVNWGGSAPSVADEWIELVNLTTDPVDISGWTLAGAASGTALITLPPGSQILSGGTFLISNYDADAPNSALALTPSYVTTTVSLSNSSLSLLLADRAGNLVDEAGDGTSPFAGSARTTGGAGGVSMLRFDPLRAGTRADAWVSAIESLGFDTGSIEKGTPGVLDGNLRPFVTVVQPIVEPTPAPVDATPVVDDPSPTISDPSAPLVPPAPPIIETINIINDPLPEPILEPVVVTPVVVPVVLPAPEVEPATVSFEKGRIVINELLPAPASGGDEYVELYNPGADLHLEGWQLQDASNHLTEISPQEFLANTYIVIESPKGALNNGGDTVTLLSPDGTAIDQVTYGTADLPAPAYEISISRTSEGLFQLTPFMTPGTGNQFPVQDPVVIPMPDPIGTVVADPIIPVIVEPVTQPVAPPETDAAAPPVSQTDPTTFQDPAVISDPSSLPPPPSSLLPPTPDMQKYPIITDFSEIEDAAVETVVTLEGIVLYGPEIVGPRRVLLGDSQQTMVLYKADKLYPALPQGTRVRVQGVVRKAMGKKRIVIRKKGGDFLTVLPEPLEETPYAQAWDSESAEVGDFVEIEAVLVKKSGKTLILETTNGTLMAQLQKNIDLTLFPLIKQAGSGVWIRGVVAERSPDKLMVFTQADIVITPALPSPETAAETIVAITDSKKKRSFPIEIALPAGAALAGLGIKRFKMPS